MSRFAWLRGSSWREPGTSSPARRPTRRRPSPQSPLDAPDAVLLDVQLPDRDGFSIATALTASGGPAVVLISSREAEDYGQPDRGLRSTRLHPEVEAVRSCIRSSRRVMSSTVVTSSQTRSVLRDPVLLVPAVVGAGLAVGWLGTDSGVSGSRVAVDLALSWALVAASLVALERPRWRRSGALLATAAFALLAADLQWASSHALWTLGFLLEALWVALLVHVVLSFPDGRPWSRAARCRDRRRIRGDVRRAAPRRFRVTRLAGRALRCAAADCGRRCRPSAGNTRHCRRSGNARPARRADCSCCTGPHNALRRRCSSAAGLTVPATVLWLVWVSATGESASDARDDRSGSLRCSFRSGSSQGSSGRGCVDARRPTSSSSCGRTGRPACASASPEVLGDPSLEVAYRLDDGRYVDAAGQPSSFRRMRVGRSRS